MEAIRIWLNGRREYKTGARLYSLYGKDLSKKRMFSEAETPYKLQQLTRELEALLVPAGSIVSVKAVRQVSSGPEPSPPATSSPPILKKEYVWSQDADEVERSIHARWKPLFVEMMDLVSRVGDLAREGQKNTAVKQQAARMALRILDLDDQVEALYNERNHYLETGQKKEAFPYGPVCEDPVLIPVKLANHQRYARNYRQKLQKDQSDTKSAEKLKEHEWFVAYYSSIIKK